MDVEQDRALFGHVLPGGRGKVELAAADGEAHDGRIGAVEREFACGQHPVQITPAAYTAISLPLTTLSFWLHHPTLACHCGSKFDSGGFTHVKENTL